MKKLFFPLIVMGLIVLSIIILGEKAFFSTIVLVSLIVMGFTKLGNEIGLGRPWAMLLLGIFLAGVLLPNFQM